MDVGAEFFITLIKIITGGKISNNKVFGRINRTLRWLKRQYIKLPAIQIQQSIILHRCCMCGSACVKTQLNLFSWCRVSAVRHTHVYSATAQCLKSVCSKVGCKGVCAMPEERLQSAKYFKYVGTPNTSLFLWANISQFYLSYSTLKRLRCKVDMFETLRPLLLLLTLSHLKYYPHN